jgi:hypothetical protein
MFMAQPGRNGVHHPPHPPGALRNTTLELRPPKLALSTRATSMRRCRARAGT